MEKFKEIPGFEGLYAVSNLGKVKNLLTNKIRKAPITQGYHRVSLTKDLRPKHYKVSRLVALTWIPNPRNKPEVNHLDGNRLNDSVKNLQWVTSSENTQHAYDTGLQIAREKPVLQYTLTMEFIREFRSPTEAMICLNYKVGCKNIAAVCRGKRRQTGGYIWRYKDDLAKEPERLVEKWSHDINSLAPGIRAMLMAKLLTPKPISTAPEL